MQGKTLRNKLGTIVVGHMCALGLLPGEFAMSQGKIKGKETILAVFLWKPAKGMQSGNRGKGCNR